MNVSLPYIYTPRPGEEISVSSLVGDAVAGARGCLLIVSSGHTVSMRFPASDVPGVAAGIAAAMHEAAGLAAPVILERPELPAGYDPVENISYRVARARCEDGRPGVQLRADDDLTPRQARELAAYLAAFADDVEREPDPALVADWASVIRDARQHGTCSPASDADIARALLRHLKDEQQREEGRG